MKTTKYFATCVGQTVALTHVGAITLKDMRFVSRLNQSEPPVKVAKYVLASGGGRPTEYAYYVGSCSCGAVHFAERMIVRPDLASNHKCNGKCRNATGPNCECSCKGANHGAN